ncbi:hypothetical protein EO98_00805 [Methanosarcina sp. 2.H.T.1A.6]|nr:hypothetical protein EO94_19275 [Methanosarcina sp. 2.H.T.1A.3]KKG21677.1 hypothetical protein EO96_03885 [Methanosarcina sp. 2.H.T.1A.8]KKG24187.1 hypothetical protein EO97_06560 [Methanosarcina sp. 2.H.T.1A.15]KKG25062.1 hypothetical protein EO98_00805 [Methanosarcina sp. 2.H.T.1A.6]
MNRPIAIKENWVSFAKYMFLKPGYNILYVSLHVRNYLIRRMGSQEWKNTPGNKLKEINEVAR